MYSPPSTTSGGSLLSGLLNFGGARIQQRRRIYRQTAGILVKQVSRNVAPSIREAVLHRRTLGEAENLQRKRIVVSSLLQALEPRGRPRVAG